MNRTDLETLREALWRRPLTPAEEEQVRAWLALHPEDAADWSLDLALSARLRELPHPPVASNFTSRVLARVAAEQRAAERAGRNRWWQVPILRRLALSGGLALAVFVSVVQYQLNQQHQRFHSVLSLSDAAAVPEVAWLEDFEAIEKLGQVPPADDELLEALR